MKKFKDHSNKQYRIFSGSSKSHELKICIFDYEYGKSTLFLNRDGEWFELPSSGGGSFTARKTSNGDLNNYNKILFTINESISKTIFGFGSERNCSIYEDGPNVLFNDAFEFSFMKRLSEDISEQSFIELPIVYVLHHYFIDSNSNTLIWIDDVKYNSSYESLRIFINGKQEEIKDVERYRDGGTTYYKLTNGDIIYTPTAFNKTLKPTFNGIEIKELSNFRFLMMLFDKNYKFDPIKDNPFHYDN